MLQIKVKTKEVQFTIPIPYAILHLAISILSTRSLHLQMNKWLKKQNDYMKDKKLSLTVPPLDKKVLKLILKVLQNYKGLVLVDVKAQDGTEVLVKL
jgi:hypothetical protein